MLDYDRINPLVCFAMLTVALAAIATLYSTRAAAESGASADARPILLTYVPAFKSFDHADLPYDKLTHICHAFASASPEGEFEIAEFMPAPQLIDMAHRRGVKVLLSLGGAESDALLAPVAADPEKLERFIDSVIEFVVEQNYDGVDLDWEFPDSEASAKGMILMVEALRARLDTLSHEEDRQYLLTRAVGGGWAYKHIPTEVFVDNFDFLNVMGYDCAGPWHSVAAHNAPLTPASIAGDQPVDSVTALLDHWRVERGIPESKLVLGLPAYGRGFIGAQMYGPVTKDPAVHTAHSYSELVQLMQDGWQTRRLENGEVWLIAPDQSQIIGFDDPESIAMKSRWAVDQSLAGVFFWEASMDIMPDGSNPLIDAAAGAFVVEPE